MLQLNCSLLNFLINRISKCSTRNHPKPRQTAKYRVDFWIQIKEINTHDKCRLRKCSDYTKKNQKKHFLSFVREHQYGPIDTLYK